MTPEETEFLENLFLQTYPKLLRYASLDLKGRERAEEAVQDAFCIACLKIKTLAAQARPELWMTRTLRNVIRNRRRTLARTQALTVPLDALETELPACGEPEDCLPLPETVPGIKPEELRLFYAVTLEGEPYASAAKRLGISETACRKRIQRTRERLRQYYGLRAHERKETAQ